MTFEHIMIPIDFSDLSQSALSAGLDLATRFEARVTLVHVTDQVDRNTWGDPDAMMAMDAVIDGELKALDHEAREQLDNVSKELEGALPEGRITQLVVSGKPARRILEVAAELQPDLIVMGSHGRHRMPDILLGSTAERVVRHAPCAVLTIKSDGFPFIRG